VGDLTPRPACPVCRAESDVTITDMVRLFERVAQALAEQTALLDELREAISRGRVTFHDLNLKERLMEEQG
jgi:hypothetical protein